MMSFELILEKLESIEGLLKEQTIDRKKVLNFKEVLYILGIGKKTLYDLIRKNGIPAYRPVGGKLFFIKKELQYWIMANKATNLCMVERMDKDLELKPDQE